MNNYRMKIKYLYNSGFTLETKNFFLVFDYYKDGINEKNYGKAGILTKLEKVDRNKKIFVFSSHSHEDHFNPDILTWINIRNDIKYILSSDIEVNEEYKNIFSLSAYDDLKVDGIYINAYGSTDIGISFLIKLDGITVFHAGDLNWWYWWDDSEENIELAEEQFKKEIERIKGEKIDIAFFPVDPRLEHNYHLGGEYFIREINPGIMIPMHFGDNYETTQNFSKMMKDYDVKVIEINRRGQEIII